MDGLEPGFLLLSSDQVPQNSRVVYQALVRNKSDKPLSFFVRMLRTNGPDRPSFGVKQAEGTGESYPYDPLYEATLAPGESMLVPVQQSIDGTQVLVVGDDGSKDRPRVRKIVPGQYRITQPITLYRGLEKSQLISLLGSSVPEITKVSSDGTLRTERSSRAGGKALPGAQTLEATRMLDVAAALPGAPGPTLPLDKVVWGKAVDGLTAGFLLTSSPRVPLNSKLTYQTLVRNTSNKPISFLTRLLQYDGYEVPTVDGKPTKGAKRTYPLDPLYSVTLAPGESVIVPGQNGQENLEIYVGEGGSSDSPSIATITPGHLKITQPLTIYHSSDHATLTELMGIYTLSKVSPEGRVRTEPANRASGKIEGAQTLEAYIYLEVGTLNAAAERSAASAIWGKVDRGLQCGLRMLTNQRTFKTGDTLEAELLWRNVSTAPISTPIPKGADLYPTLSDAKGHALPIDFGARLNLYPPTMSVAVSEIRSLGVIALTLVSEGTPSPKSNLEPGHITLTPGTYRLSAWGGVSAPGGPNPKSGEVAFTVVGDVPQPQKADGIAWGKEAEGYRYGLRNPGTGEALEVWVQNVAKETRKLTYAAYPPEMTGSLSLRDSKNKPVSAPMDSIDTSTVSMTKVLRSGEKALILAPSLKNALPLLKPSETYTAQWENKTGKLTFRVPQREGTARSQKADGVQLALRLPKGVTTFSKLSEARFEVVLRNLGKPTSVSWITPANFGFYGPHLFTKDGEPIPYEHTVAGPYLRESRELGSGETIVLGTIRIPRKVQEQWDSLPQGPYLTSGPPPPSPYEARFSLGITVPGKSEQNLTARLPFTVTRPR